MSNTPLEQAKKQLEKAQVTYNYYNTIEELLAFMESLVYPTVNWWAGETYSKTGMLVFDSFDFRAIIEDESKYCKTGLGIRYYSSKLSCGVSTEDLGTEPEYKKWLLSNRRVLNKLYKAYAQAIKLFENS